MVMVPVYQQQWPAPPPFNVPPVLSSILLIDATGEKASMNGRVWNKDRATKNISTVGFRFGAVTKAGGSALTVSLQDLNTAVNSPLTPDETQDQTVAIANGNASFASNTFITVTLGSTRTVAFGENLCVVVEYDGAGRLGADSVVISGTTNVGNVRNLAGAASLKTGGTWAVADNVQNVVLGFDDGTYGTLLDSYPYSAITTNNFNSGSAADEFALEFTVPFTMKVDGAWVHLLVTATGTMDVVLYDGTTPMVTVSSLSFSSTGATRFLRVPFAEQTLVPGHTYRLSAKPTTATNISIVDLTVADVLHWQAWPLDGSGSVALATRVDGGAWTTTTTRRPLMGLYQSAIDIPAGGLFRRPSLEGF